MSPHWLNVNPFGKTDITIEVDNKWSESVRVTRSNGKRGMALEWERIHAEIDWTDQEIFAIPAGVGAPRLYVFRKNGEGFLLANDGEQYNFVWY